MLHAPGYRHRQYQHQIRPADGTGWQKTWRALTVDFTIDDYAKSWVEPFLTDGLSSEAVDGVVIASVVPDATRTAVHLSEHHLKHSPLVVEGGIETGVERRVDNPHNLGADRIANAVAAKTLFGVPIIVVDSGTATKREAIDADGVYLGGAIALGAELGSSGLAEAAALLKEVDLAPPASSIGRNTVKAIQSVLFWGHIAMIEGLVMLFKAEMGAPQPRVIATGGFASLLARYTSVIDEVARC